MNVIRNPRQLRKAIVARKRKGATVGFVPTMGALHPGHASLIARARRENDVVVVSIFVNPLQFGPREDLKRYPRTVRSDLKLCRGLGADIVFLPAPGMMYPRGTRTFVEVEGLGNVLCGASRPGHFRGVATVVAKLFNMVRPDTAYFGQKDAQQALIIRRMIADLNFPVRLVVLPTVREADGLAMSSRNRYLSPAQRSDALVLQESLRRARALIAGGERRAAAIIAAMREIILSRNSARLDYAAVVDIDTLRPLKILKGSCLIAVAVFIGKTRLIDNAIVVCRSPGGRRLARR